MGRMWCLTQQTPKGVERVALGQFTSIEALRADLKALKPRLTNQPKETIKGNAAKVQNASVQQAPTEVSREVQRDAPNQQATDKTVQTEPARLWAVVRPLTVIDDGKAAICEVDRACLSSHDAELFTRRKANLAPWPEALPSEPRAGDKLLYQVTSTTSKLNRLIQKAQWQAETRGQFFTLGVWFSKDVHPKPGMPVSINPHAEYRGEARDHRIEPRRIVTAGEGHEPGEPERPIYIIVRDDPKRTLKGVIEEMHFDRKIAVARKAELEHTEVLNPKTKSDNIRNNNLNAEDFGSRLRQIR
jgi:hypothetical protein